MGCSSSNLGKPLSGHKDWLVAHSNMAPTPHTSTTGVQGKQHGHTSGQEQFDNMLLMQPDENGVALPPPPKKLDPRLPLNERQLLGIKNSWKAIGQNMGTTAVSMFIKLFETNMDLKNQFENFKDLTHIHDLRLAKGFKEHAILVMCTLDEAINNLDDVPYVIDMLRRTGNTHKRFPGFLPENFYAVEEPFLMAVQEQLGDRFSFGFQVAYKRIIYFFLDTLVGGFKS